MSNRNYTLYARPRNILIDCIEIIREYLTGVFTKIRTANYVKDNEEV